MGKESTIWMFAQFKIQVKFYSRREFKSEWKEPQSILVFPTELGTTSVVLRHCSVLYFSPQSEEAPPAVYWPTDFLRTNQKLSCSLRPDMTTLISQKSTFRPNAAPYKRRYTIGRTKQCHRNTRVRVWKIR